MKCPKCCERRLIWAMGNCRYQCRVCGHLFTPVKRSANEDYQYYPATEVYDDPAEMARVFETTIMDIPVDESNGFGGGDGGGGGAGRDYSDSPVSFDSSDSSFDSSSPSGGEE